jgi:ligand-binding sensor domain-containing protein
LATKPISLVKTWIFVLSLFLSVSGFAQSRNYLFSDLGIRRGLADDEVNCVQQDYNGYMWIATMNGLQRFDGRRFVSFQHADNDASTIPADEVMDLYMDGNKRLWILCLNEQVGYINVDNLSYHPVSLKSFGENSQISETKFIPVAGTDGPLLLRESVILKYDNNSASYKVSVDKSGLPQKWKPNAVFKDNANNYWIAADSGIIKYNANNKITSYRGHNTENDDNIKILGKHENVTAICI